MEKLRYKWDNSLVRSRAKISPRDSDCIRQIAVLQIQLFQRFFSMSPSETTVPGAAVDENESESSNWKMTAL